MIAQFENALLHGEYKKIVGSLMIDSTKPIDDATPYHDLSGLKLPKNKIYNVERYLHQRG